jgi:hypothetical protein
MSLNTHDVLVSQGQFFGKRYTRLTVAELREIDDDYAKSELLRRGVTNSKKCIISNHAIDSASLRLLNVYKKDRQEHEGLYSWLLRKAETALTQPGHVYQGLRFVFTTTCPPVLKTVCIKNNEVLLKSRL